MTAHSRGYALTASLPVNATVAGLAPVTSMAALATLIGTRCTAMIGEVKRVIAYVVGELDGAPLARQVQINEEMIGRLLAALDGSNDGEVMSQVAVLSADNATLNDMIGHTRTVRDGLEAYSAKL